MVGLLGFDFNIFQHAMYGSPRSIKHSIFGVLYLQPFSYTILLSFPSHLQGALVEILSRPLRGAAWNSGPRSVSICGWGVCWSFSWSIGPLLVSQLVADPSTMGWLLSYGDCWECACVCVHTCWTAFTLRGHYPSLILASSWGECGKLCCLLHLYPIWQLNIEDNFEQILRYPSCLSTAFLCTLLMGPRQLPWPGTCREGGPASPNLV